MTCVRFPSQAISIPQLLSRIQYNVPVNETLTFRSNASDFDDVRVSGSPVGRLSVDLSTDDSQTEAVITVGMKDGPASSVQACFMRTSDGWGVDIYVRIA